MQYMHGTIHEFIKAMGWVGEGIENLFKVLIMQTYVRACTNSRHIPAVRHCTNKRNNPIFIIGVGYSAKNVRYRSIQLILYTAVRTMQSKNRFSIWRAPCLATYSSPWNINGHYSII